MTRRPSHLDEAGRARMVDVGGKRPTRRRAVARGEVRFDAAAFEALRDNRLAKGDALAVARLAGLQAAKRTSDWIPLCHPLALDHLAIEIELEDSSRMAVVEATAAARGRTGVEMEALVAVSAACLALYDMAKSLDRAIVIGEIRLLEKEGGRSGRWSAPR
jgi:cyclic pyranopterin phosphate synthase